MNKRKTAEKRLKNYAKIAISHGITAVYFRTQSQHYLLFLSRGDEKYKPLIFADTGSEWRAAMNQRQVFRRAMRSFGIEIDNTGLFLSFHTRSKSSVL